MLSTAISFYLLAGLMTGLMTLDRNIKFSARAIVFFGWPWFLKNEATPKVAKFLKWADSK